MKNKKLTALIFLISLIASIIAFAGCNDAGNSESESTVITAKYTVTFNVNGGSAVESLVLKAGENISLPKEPVRNYYSFAGWYGDSALKTKYVFGVMPQTDITLYAKWLPEQAVMINFTSNGGNAVDEIISKAGGEITEPAVPVKTGYTFAGWYSDEKLTSLFTFDKAPDVNTVLYAKWVRADGYNYVTCMLNGDFYGKFPVKSGEKVECPELSDQLLTEGWYEDSSYTVKYNFESAVNADKTLYAVCYTSGLKIEGGAVTGYTGSEANITIPSIFGGQEITSVADSAFLGNTTVTKIVLPETVTEIGKCAFYRCTYLADINITSAVKNIGNYAFYKNERLLSYGDIGGLTSVSEGMFLGCEKLTSITVPNGITKIGAYAFADCVALDTLKLPESVSVIGDYALSGCSNIVSFNIPRSLSNLGNGVFSDCKSIKYITVSDGNAKFSIYDKNLYTDMKKTLVMYLQADKEDTSYVARTETKILQNAFADNTNLKSVSIGKNVLTIEKGALKNMKSLENLTVPFLGNGDDKLFLAYIFGAETSTANNINSVYVPSTLKTVTLLNSLSDVPAYAFYGCSGLETINGLTDISSVGNYAFAYSGIKNINISSEITELGVGALQGCASLQAITVDDGNEYFADYDGCLYDKDLEKLLCVPAAKTTIDFPSTVKVISESAFVNSKIENIVIPDSVQEIEYSAFVNCNSLKTFKTPFIGGSRNENNYFIYIFGGICTLSTDTSGEETAKFSYTDSYPLSLKTVEYTGSENISDYAFTYCNNLETLNYGDSVTSIGKYAFYGTALTKFNLGKNVISIGAYSFASIETLSGEIVIPGKLTEIGRGALAYNKNITKVTFEEGVSEISDYMFFADTAVDSSTGTYYYFSSLTEISIPSTVTKIGVCAFTYAGYNYDTSTSAYVWNYLTLNFTAGSKLTEIGEASFAYSGLRKIDIPASVETIGIQAFYNCSYLANVTFGDAVNTSSLKTLGGISFSYCKNLASFIIYKKIITSEDVPAINEYKDDNNKAYNIFYGGNIPAVEVYGAAIYKTAALWSDYAKCITEIA